MRLKLFKLLAERNKESEFKQQIGGVVVVVVGDVGRQGAETQYLTIHSGHLNIVITQF